MDGRRKSNNGLLPHGILPYLRKAGWTPQRVVATSLYEGAYELEGLSLLSKAKQFLHTFGGLIIRYITKSQQEDVLGFLAERAVQGMGGGGLEGFEELIGVSPFAPSDTTSSEPVCYSWTPKGGYLAVLMKPSRLLARRAQRICNILTGVPSEGSNQVSVEQSRSNQDRPFPSEKSLTRRYDHGDATVVYRSQ